MTSSLITLATIGAVQLLAVMSPGPSFLITAQTAVARSRADGVKVALGLGAGTVMWAAAALLGLNVLFHQVHWLFVAMKVAGALFLIWIAYQIFRHAADPIALEAAQKSEAGSDAARAQPPFVRGVLTQISNPKVVVFFGSIFVAMLPREVPPWMIVALLVIVTLNEIVWYSLVSLFFGAAPVRTFYIRAKRWIDRVTGVFLGVLGLRLLWRAGDAG
ncbi:MAG: LysE family transporter [Rhizobiales bacterium]|nr:LysE family transporter [Hyphomicrobiales bacterium]